MRTSFIQARRSGLRARWGLPGAEAVPKLRALNSNGDFDTYWTHHLQQEKQRVHTHRYLNGIIPA